MQKIEGCALEAIRCFQQAIEHLIGIIWVTDCLHPIFPKLMQKS